MLDSFGKSNDDVFSVEIWQMFCGPNIFVLWFCCFWMLDSFGKINDVVFSVEIWLCV